MFCKKPTFRLALRCFLATYALFFVLLAAGTSGAARLHAQTLSRYTCLAKHFSTELWLKQYDRKFDKNGVVVQKGQYHPLSIAFYGIMNYDDYQATKDTSLLRRIANQFAFFTVDSNLTWIDDKKGAGMPYRYNVKDLKAPWYSGMTQGVGISFMLRYYALTKDKKALTLAQQFAYFMLRPVAKGGTIGKTPEGHTWIEEYPNSKQSPQVLNGFINGLIGLYEYTLFFPEDTLAARIHRESFQSMLKCLPLYDTPSWTNYHRSSSVITNQYLRYQLSELEHLLELYDEPLLERQMKIWAFFAHQKHDRELKFYYNPVYQYGVKMFNNGKLDPKVDSLFAVNGMRKLASVMLGKTRQETKLPLPWKPKKWLEITLPHPTTLLALKLDSIHGNVKWEATTENEAGLPISLDATVKNNSIHLKNCEPFSNVKLRATQKTFKQSTLQGVDYHYLDNIHVPMFLFDTLSLQINLKKDSPYIVNYDAENICDLTVFYKYADKAGAPLKQAHWKANQYIPKGEPFLAPADGFYSFLYVFRYQHPEPTFMNFRVTSPQ